MKYITNRINVIVFYFKRLEVFATVLSNIRYKLKGRLLIYKKGKFDLHPSSKIIIKGTLGFNYKHSKKDPFPSYLEMSEDAVLQVDKGCTIYSNSYIYIGKNAKLKLGSGYINRGAKISCYASISIGERVIIAEGVTIRDSDNH